MSAGRQNGYDSAKVKKHVGNFEALDADILKEHMAYMSRVGEIKKDQQEVLEAAKADGIPTKALRRVLKTHKLEAQIEKNRDYLESDEQDDYDLLRHALGELPDEIDRKSTRL